MKLQHLLAAGLTGLLFASGAPASAATDVPLGHFRMIELNGGGRLLVRYGPVQRVSILQGDASVSDLYLSNDDGDHHRGRHGRPTSTRGEKDRLVIDMCRERCPAGYKLVVQVETPAIQALAVNGGGQIDVAAGFPRESEFAAAVHGGGMLDARALAASSTAAAVDGGGEISVGSSDSFAAAITGGGHIRYRGHPQVATNIEGGGVVERLDR